MHEQDQDVQSRTQGGRQRRLRGEQVFNLFDSGIHVDVVESQPKIPQDVDVADIIRPVLKLEFDPLQARLTDVARCAARWLYAKIR